MTEDDPLKQTLDLTPGLNGEPYPETWLTILDITPATVFIGQQNRYVTIPFDDIEKLVAALERYKRQVN